MLLIKKRSGAASPGLSTLPSTIMRPLQPPRTAMSQANSPVNDPKNSGLIWDSTRIKTSSSLFPGQQARPGKLKMMVEMTQASTERDSQGRSLAMRTEKSQSTAISPKERSLQFASTMLPLNSQNAKLRKELKNREENNHKESITDEQSMYYNSVMNS